MTGRAVTTLALFALACGGSKDDTDAAGGTTPTVVVTETGDSGGRREPPNPFDATNVTFEFDGILLRDGTLTGYWDSDTAHDFPAHWNPPSVSIEFADELLFDGESDSDEVREAHTCAVATEYVFEAEDELDNENDAEVHAAFEGYLNMFYYEEGDSNLTFTDCAGELDEDTWGVEGRDLWMAWDGARFGLAFGAMGETDLRPMWSDDDWALYEDSLIAAYIAVNEVNDAGDLVYVGDALASCLMFEYDPVTGELVDRDDDNQLERMDISGVPAGAPLPEGYVRCFAYWWPSLGSFDLSRLAEGANGSPDGTTTTTP